MICPPNPSFRLLRKPDFAGFCSAQGRPEGPVIPCQGRLLTPAAPRRPDCGAHRGVVTVEWER